MADWKQIAQIVRMTHDKQIAVKLANDWSEDQPRSQDGKFASSGTSKSSSKTKSTTKPAEVKEVETRFGFVTSDISKPVVNSIHKHLDSIHKRIKDVVNKAVEDGRKSGKQGSFTRETVVDQVEGDIAYKTAERLQQAWENDKRLADAWAKSKGKKVTSVQKMAKEARKNPDEAIDALLKHGNTLQEVSDYDIAFYVSDYWDNDEEEDYDDYDSYGDRYDDDY